MVDLEEATIQNNTREHHPMLDNITQLVVYKPIMPTHKQTKLSPAGTATRPGFAFTTTYDME